MLSALPTVLALALAALAVLAGLRAQGRERRARREAQELLDVAGALLVAVDARGRLTLLNPRASEVLGLDPATALGRDWFTLAVPPELRDAGRARLAALLASGSDAPLELEYDTLTGDGGRRRIAWHIRTTRGRGGRPTGTLSSGEDVTERRAAEAQLARDHEDLAALRRLAHEVAAREDARQAVVRGLAELSGAPVGVLAEASEDGLRLTVTAVHGWPELEGEVIDLGREPSALGAALRSGRPVWLGAMAGSPLANPRLARMAGMGALLAHPVQLEGRPRAVLTAVWPEPRDDVDERTRTLVALAADEAAVALGRLAILRRLEAAALTDPLTGVANRRAWDDALPLALRRAARTGEPLAVAALDLNEFKSVNDRHGHEAGDRLLTACTDAWLGQLRATDVLARVGGDEFGIVLPDCGPQDLAQVVHRLRRVTPHRPGAAIGIVVWDGTESARDLLRRADQALYEDKAHGKGAALEDPARLAAVRATGLLDGATDEELEHLTELVSWLLDVPVALVTLVTDDRQAFAANCGLGGWAGEQAGTPLTHSFCQHAVTTARPLVVRDAREHPLLRGNPAIPDLGVVAYAGIPLLDDDGHVLGVLCAVDTEPRDWSPDELTTLRQLAGRAALTLTRRARAAR